MKTIKINEIEYVNVQELSKYLDTGYRAIYDKLNENGISSIFLGKSRYYILSECTDIINFYELKRKIKKIN